MISSSASPTASESQAAPKSRKVAVAIGWVLSVIPCLLLIFSGSMKFTGSKELIEGVAHLGWPADKMPLLGVLEVGSVILYLIPQTAMIGVILLTGYMGGAIATHLRIGEPVVVQTLLPIVLWLGLYLRDVRLHALIPFRRSAR